MNSTFSLSFYKNNQKTIEGPTTILALLLQELWSYNLFIIYAVSSFMFLSSRRTYTYKDFNE